MHPNKWKKQAQKKMKTSLDLGVKYLPINLTESTFHCNDA